jgi:uncharacterized protein (TIGR02453 family)
MIDFSPRVFEFYDGLERENTKAYFTATRDFYEDEVRGALEDLLHALGGDVWLSRQQRDLRFTPDKTPYKTRTYGVAGRLYVSLSAEGIYVGTGYYRPQRDQLERLRAAIADDATGPALEAAVEHARQAGLDVVGDELKTAPRGYPRDHPRIALLRLKQLVAGRRLPRAAGGITHERALEHARATWAQAEPMIGWLDEHVGPSTLPPAPRR